ncbi:MAG: glycosyltransferase family 2 protein [Flavobacteriales bacterium]|nr:glycosyltransferase family 2 protein [Flavobacteriales bacterium]
MNAVIAILNWNGRDLLERFLPSVVQYSEGHTVAIIDNASTDSSKRFVSSRYPDIEWIQLDKNYGYAGGYNKGLEGRTEDIAILLNSDVEVTSGWLGPILEQMREDVSIVAAQPKILDANKRSHFEYAGASGGFLDKLNYPYCRGRLFETLEEDEGQYDEPIEIQWATGACLFFRLKDYFELRGLDEDLFAHMEEIDLCWRARRSGKRVMCFPQSEVYHLGGGTLSGYKPFKSFLNFKNSLIIFLKNDRSGYTWSRLFLRMILDGLSIVRFLTQFRGRHAFAVLKAHIYFYSSLRSTIAKRKALGKSRADLADRSIVFDYFVSGKKKFSELN